MIVSKFTTFNENFVICCNQITQFFCTKYGSANETSARGPCNFRPLADLAISVFRELTINSVYPNPHFSQAQDLMTVHEKNQRVNLYVQELYHLRDFL